MSRLRVTNPAAAAAATPAVPPILRRNYPIASLLAAYKVAGGTQTLAQPTITLDTTASAGSIRYIEVGDPGSSISLANLTDFNGRAELSASFRVYTETRTGGEISGLEFGGFSLGAVPAFDINSACFQVRWNSVTHLWDYVTNPGNGSASNLFSFGPNPNPFYGVAMRLVTDYLGNTACYLNGTLAASRAGFATNADAPHWGLLGASVPCAGLFAVSGAAVGSRLVTRTDSLNVEIYSA